MGEKGSLKNKRKEWLRRRKHNKKIKEQEQLKNLQKQTKENEIEDEIQSFRSCIKNSLKTVFGYLLSIVEQLSINALHNKEKRIDNKQQNIKKTKADIVDVKVEQTIQRQPICINRMEAATENTVILTSITKESFKNEVEETHALENIKTEIEKITKHITTLKQDFCKAATENYELDKKRKEFIFIKEEIQKVKKQYETFAEESKLLEFENLKELEAIDLYDLRYNSKKITGIIAACDKELSKIKQQKIKLNDNNKKLKQVAFVRKDMNQLKVMIDENLKEQQLDIDHIRNLFNKVELQKKRGIIITGMHNFLSKTLNIGLGLLPLKICKNKWFGMLGSTVIINNRLRGMRKMIRKENQTINYITYKNIMNSIQNEKSCIQKMNEILSDTWMQLENLKQEFIMEFYYDMDRYPEVDDIMSEFSSITYELTSKKLELEKHLEKVEKQAKLKVKVME